eukprot:s671_g13.t1
MKSAIGAHGRPDGDVDGACGHMVLMPTVMPKLMNQCPVEELSISKDASLIYWIELHPNPSAPNQVTQTVILSNIVQNDHAAKAKERPLAFSAAEYLRTFSDQYLVRSMMRRPSGSGSVEDLKLQAQRALETGIRSLVHAERKVLQDESTVGETGLQDGDVLTAVARPVLVWSSPAGSAFAVSRSDGFVFTWGLSMYGGDSSAVKDQLWHVKHVCVGDGASAAVREDGTVITWGDDSEGGDSSKVSHDLHEIREVKASHSAFAALRSDGEVITWGAGNFGGLCLLPRDQIRNVKQVESSYAAFAAIRDDGSVVAWGDERSGGDCSKCKRQLVGVVRISSTSTAFAAVTSRGQVVTWGDRMMGADSSSVADKLQNVQSVEGSTGAFAALRKDGTVVTWGPAAYGGDSRKVQEQLYDIQLLRGSVRAFAALRQDGSVRLGMLN